MINKIFILTGMHRSGTTFTGNILSKLDRVVSLYEPFNVDYGLRNNNISYKYLKKYDCDEQFDVMLNDVFQLKGKYKKRAYTDNFHKKIFRYIINGRSDIEQIKAKIKLFYNSGIKYLLVKDPFLMMTSEYLCQNYDTHIVILVRHPMAIWSSLNRVQWPIDLDNFGGDLFWKDLSSKTGEKRSDILKMDKIEKFCFIWNNLYRYALTAKNIFPDKIKIVIHEDLCTEPIFTFNDISHFLEIDLTPKLESFINKSTTGEMVMPSTTIQHNLRRNSTTLAYSWTSNVDEKQEMRIFELTKDVYKDYYGEWRKK